MCFFGFLRSREVVLPVDQSFDPLQYLFTDIAVDNPAHPTFIKVSIKQLKTDPFKRVADIIIGSLGGVLCPMAAILLERKVTKWQSFCSKAGNGEAFSLSQKSKYVSFLS